MSVLSKEQSSDCPERDGHHAVEPPYLEDKYGAPVFFENRFEPRGRLPLR